MTSIKDIRRKRLRLQRQRANRQDKSNTGAPKVEAVVPKLDSDKSHHEPAAQAASPDGFAVSGFDGGAQPPARPNGEHGTGSCAPIDGSTTAGDLGPKPGMELTNTPIDREPALNASISPGGEAHDQEPEGATDHALEANAASARHNADPPGGAVTPTTAANTNDQGAEMDAASHRNPGHPDVGTPPQTAALEENSQEGDKMEPAGGSEPEMTAAQRVTDESRVESSNFSPGKNLIIPDGEESLVASLASQISENWQREGIDAVMNTARRCAEANSRLTAAQKRDLIKQLPFKGPAFSKYVQDGNDSRLTAPEIQRMLPPHYTKIYDITLLTDAELHQAISEGVITPDMKRTKLAKWCQAKREAASQTRQLPERRPDGTNPTIIATLLEAPTRPASPEVPDGAAQSEPTVASMSGDGAPDPRRVDPATSSEIGAAAMLDAPPTTMPVAYLWSPYIPIPGVTVIVGSHTSAIDLIVIKCAASIITRAAWPDRGRPPIGHVLWATAEPDAESPVRLHLQALEANGFSFHFAISETDDHSLPIHHFSTDLYRLRQELSDLGNITLVVVDCFRPYLAFVEVELRMRRFRPALAALGELSAEFGVSIIVPFPLPYRSNSGTLKDGIDAVVSLSEIGTAFVIEGDGHHGTMVLRKCPSGANLGGRFPFHVKCAGNSYESIEWDPASAARRPTEPSTRDAEPNPLGELPAVSGSTIADVPIPATANSAGGADQPAAGEKPAVALSETPKAPAAEVIGSADVNASKPRLTLRNPPTSKIEPPPPVRRNPASLERALGFGSEPNDDADGK